LNIAKERDRKGKTEEREEEKRDEKRGLKRN
jgi:hypothetical protein